MFNTEFDKEIRQFTKENISLDIDSAKPNEDICFHYGISYYYINNGFDIFHAISRKYATNEILPEQLRQMMLPAILDLKRNFSHNEAILKELHKVIENSIKENTILLPVTGIEVQSPFQIGSFTLWSKSEYIEKNKQYFDKDVNSIEKGFPSTIAVAKLRSHPDSAKEIGKSILKSELNQLKAFIPYLNDFLKYWIQPLKTNTTLSDCFFVYGSYGISSGMSHIANLKPLNIDAKDSSNSESFREFLIEQTFFQSIVDGRSKFWQALKMGYEWIGKQYDEDRLENKLIYSIFALECLLANANNFSSITAAISEKCAYLIGDTKEKRLEIFNLSKELYSLRSALVHGYSKNTVTEEKVWLAYGLAMAVYRRITKMVVDGVISSQEELDNFILNRKFE